MAGKASKAPLVIALLLALTVVLGIWLVSHHSSNPPDTSSKPKLADLGTSPDWSRLDPYQQTITRDQFLHLVESVYAIGPAWKNYINIQESKAVITTDSSDPKAPAYELIFATKPSTQPPERFWRSANQLGTAPAHQPLQGIHIAIDPGHIGGDFAQIEARWFIMSQEDQPVMEGEMTLATAKHLKPRLEKLGAKVSLLRTENSPVTTKSADDFKQFAKDKLGKSTPDEVRSLAERLFYRTAEIRARAKLVNEQLKPDLVLCLHYNAESWGNPLNPELSDRNHFHLLLNGAYTNGEVAHDDERFEMMLKILQGNHTEELALAKEQVPAFKEHTGLPPYEYEPLSLRALRLDDNSYIWARNLLANRLYECPVLFFEPYVMNSTEVHARAQAGDYEGLRTIGERELPSIFREYADAVTLGLERYYRKHRNP